MAKDPAFLFYPNDWLGGTLGMSFEEKGAYMELLMLQFNRGHMDGHMCGQVVGQLWDKIKVKFSVDEHGLFYNARLEEEKNKRQNFTGSRRNNLLGNNQHTKKGEKKEGHIEGHTTSRMENENEDKDSIGGKGEKKDIKFRIGLKDYNVKVSEWLSENYEAFLEQWAMKKKQFTNQQVFDKLDVDYFAKTFDDQDHVKNSFIYVYEKMAKDSRFTPKEEPKVNVPKTNWNPEQ